MSQSSFRQTWLSNPRMDILSGITVALALIPEAIAFSIIAGVDPMVGLYASVTMAIAISLAGGRPAMISAATGAMALLMADLVKDHGIEYLFAATLLTGVLQFILGSLRLGRFITFVPHSVMTGFVNALAILIFAAQLVHFHGQSWMMYALVALTLAIIYTFPLLTKAFPSALAAIIVVSLIAIVFHLDVKTVGDMGRLTSALPTFHVPSVEVSFDTLRIIFPYALSLSLVGLLESLLTATIVDEMTGTRSSKNREMRGQGIANVVTGFFGGMAGCAMIGQSVINVKSGGRTRLSTFTAGAFLLFLIVIASQIVKEIPMAALVGVMFMVSFGTFDWGFVRRIHLIPRTDALVMIVTVAIVVVTSDLSKGVFAGVILSAVIFAWRMTRIRADIRPSEGPALRTYEIQGQLFFGTTSHFVDLFAYETDPEQVVIDFSHTHVWDQSAAAGIAKAMSRYREAGKRVKLHGLNQESRSLVEKAGFVASGTH